MKQINLDSSNIMSHLHYCLGLYENDLHQQLRKVKDKETGNFYLVKRPYGKILNFINKDYPEQYFREKFLKVSYKTRKKIGDFLKKNFESIITSQPSELLKIENDLYELLESNENKKELNGFLKHIFNYELFTNEDPISDWNAYKFIQNLGVSVCVYCNAQFTHTIIKDDGGESIFKIRPALDHVFTKSKHPLLAVSIYNLIPSCDTCNSGLKATSEVEFEELIHPYLEDINDIAVFTRKFDEGSKDYYSMIVGKDSDYSIKFMHRKDSDLQRVRVYEKMFGIENRYEMHKSYLNKQIVLSLIYNTVYLNRLDLSFDKVAFSRDFVKDILYNTDINNMILSKLVSDTIEEIKKSEQFFSEDDLVKLRAYLKE